MLTNKQTVTLEKLSIIIHYTSLRATDVVVILAILLLPQHTTAALQNSAAKDHVRNSTEVYCITAGYSVGISVGPQHFPAGNSLGPVYVQNTAVR